MDNQEAYATEPYFVILLHGRGKLPQFLENLPDMPLLFDTEEEAKASLPHHVALQLTLDGWEWTIVKLQDRG